MSRRLRVIQISDVVFNRLLRAAVFPNCPVATNVPLDLEVRGFRHKDGKPWTMEALVESATFDEVPEGAEPPLFIPTYTLVAAS